MKNKRKLGQAIIEYVLLLIIPVLLISVLPNLNKTVELTLNTVGVDLMEEEGQTPDTPDPICNDEDMVSISSRLTAASPATYPMIPFVPAAMLPRNTFTKTTVPRVSFFAKSA